MSLMRIFLWGSIFVALMAMGLYLSFKRGWFHKEFSHCDTCTQFVFGHVKKSIVLEDGDVLCIGEKGRFEGTLYRWDGKDTVTICNEGIFNPSKLSIHSGRNVILNHGIMSPEYMRIFSKSTDNLIVNFEGAILAPQKMYTGRASYVLKNYGDFSPTKLHVSTKSSIFNYPDANISNQKLRITGGGQVVNNGFWWVEEPLTEKEIQQIDNRGKMVTGGFPLAAPNNQTVLEID